MRAALSILGLVIAFAVVMFMMKKQAQQLVVKPAAATASAPATTSAPDAVRRQVQEAMDQAAARASESQP